MYKMCKTEQSAQRQRQLEQGLLAAMSSRQYDQIAVSDLCDQLGVPRKSFYRYFSSKDGALHALIDHTLLEFESFASDDRREEKRTYERDLEQFFRFWKNRKQLLDALMRSNLIGVLFERCILHATSEEGMPKRFLPQNEKTAREYAVMFGICGLFSLVTQWHRGGFSQTSWEMARIAAALMTQPLFSDKENLL